MFNILTIAYKVKCLFLTRKVLVGYFDKISSVSIDMEICFRIVEQVPNCTV